MTPTMQRYLPDETLTAVFQSPLGLDEGARLMIVDASWGVAYVETPHHYNGKGGYADMMEIRHRGPDADPDLNLAVLCDTDISDQHAGEWTVIATLSIDPDAPPNWAWELKLYEERMGSRARRYFGLDY